MKACESCQRVVIGQPYERISALRVFFGLFFVYSPLVFLPFILAPAFLVYVHLRLMGARNLKGLGDFLPAKESHRYAYKSQIVVRKSPWPAFWTRTRLYWLFNCTWYCPFSVATLEWFTYLVKVVENWWCPFAHARKPHYADAAIDASYWHNELDSLQLHPMDRDNPIWNAQGALETHPGRRALPTAAKPKVLQGMRP